MAAGEGAGEREFQCALDYAARSDGNIFAEARTDSGNKSYLREKGRLCLAPYRLWQVLLLRGHNFLRSKWRDTMEKPCISQRIVAVV